MEARSNWLELLDTPFEQTWVDAGGVRTRVLAAGDPDLPPLVFLHGTGGHAEAYIRNLGPHGEHFRTYVIDMVGHGFSAKPAIDYEIGAYVDHLADFMDAVGAERAHLSGESLGGWVAARFAAQHPERVDRLVLNTSGGLTAFPEVMKRLKELSMAAAREPSRQTVRTRLEFLMADPSHVTDELVETRYRIYCQPGFVDAMERILCLQEPEIRQRNLLTEAELDAIAAPTLVLWTTHDPTAGVDVGQRMADAIDGARLVVMEDCGHWPQFESADEFNRIHTEFLLGG